MTKHWRKIKTVVIAGAIGGVLSTLGMNCSRFEVVSNSSEGGGSTLAAPAEAPMPVALLSSEQLLKSMISATGTEGLGELDNPADDLIRQVYNDRSGSLPSGQDLKLISGPTMISITNLASAVCAKAVDRDRALGADQSQDRLFFREFDFARGAEAQTNESLSMAAQRLARNAWRRDATDEELSMFVQFGSEYKAQATAGDIKESRLLAISLCTGVLSSFDAVTY